MTVRRVGRALVAAVFLVATGSLGAMGELSLASAGGIAWDLGACTITMDANVTTAWKHETGSLLTSIDLTESGVESLTLEAAATIGDLAFSASATFDVPLTALEHSEVGLILPFAGTTLSVRGVLEQGFGVEVQLAGSENSLLELVTVGLNVDTFGAVQTDSCSAPFTYAEIDCAVPLACCDETFDVSVTFDDAGFTELAIGWPGIPVVPLGIQVGTLLIYEPYDKALTFSPALSMENPDCFDVYFGLMWDDATREIDGLELYGLGFRCEIGEVSVRALFSFDPATVALIKSPYNALLGLVWDIAGCCADGGEGSVALFFGDANLFDLEEIDAALTLPVIEGFTLSVNCQFAMAGTHTVALGWSLEI